MPDPNTQLLRSMMEALVRIEAKQDRLLGALEEDDLLAPATSQDEPLRPIDPSDPK